MQATRISVMIYSPARQTDLTRFSYVLRSITAGILDWNIFYLFCIKFTSEQLIQTRKYKGRSDLMFHLSCYGNERVHIAGTLRCWVVSLWIAADTRSSCFYFVTCPSFKIEYCGF
jgi:hypothetical protein